MCGRFVRTSPVEKIVKRFEAKQALVSEVGPDYNVAPQRKIIVIDNDMGDRRLTAKQWGFLPSWAKDPAVGQRMINARAETVTVKPTFRHAFNTQRCLIIADGYYEWRKEGGIKIPMFISLKSGEPIGLAGLCNDWQSPDGSEVSTCAIITTEATGLLRSIHDRMPLIIPEWSEDFWLNTSTHKDRLMELLKPGSTEKLEVYEVSNRVNFPVNNSPENILPVAQSLM